MFSFYRKAITFCFIILGFGSILLAQNISISINTTDGEIGPFPAFDADFGYTFGFCDEFTAVGEIAQSTDTEAPTLACGMDSLVNDLTGKIAVIDRGACAFVEKCINAQNAGAIAAIIITDDRDPGRLGGADPNITIPCVMLGLSREEGQVIKDNLDGTTVSIKADSGNPFEPADIVYWGDERGQGDFNGGLNGWTSLNYSACPADTLEGGFPLWRWSASPLTMGSFSADRSIESPTICDGAVIFDSDFYDNSGMGGDFIGTGSCPSPHAGTLISPTIDLSNTADISNLNVRFHQSLAWFAEQSFYVGWSIDDGMTWDSVLVNEDIEQATIVDETELVALPDSVRGESAVRIKFTFDGDYYFWIIDDVRLVEVDGTSVNIGFVDSTIVIPPYATIPAAQIETDNSLLSFTPAAAVINTGFGPSTDTKIEAAILAGDNVIYSDSATVSMVEVDSLSGLVELSTYENALQDEGVYVINYNTSSNNNELDEADNVTSSRFNVTQDAYSKARWDVGNNLPTRTGNFFGGGSPFEYIMPIEVVKGIGYEIESISFYPLTRTGETLGGLTFEAYVYQWNDLNEDGAYSNDEITALAFGFFEFEADFPDRFADAVTVSMIDLVTFEEGPYELVEDDLKLLIGIRSTETNDRDVFFAYDNGISYRGLIDQKNAAGTLTDFDFQYVNADEFLEDGRADIEQSGLFQITGLGVIYSPPSIGVIIQEVEVDVENILEEGTYEYIIYPSPVSEELTVEFKLKERTPFIEFRVIDAMGREVFRARENGFVTENTSTFNVSDLPVGQYFLNVATKEGHVSKAFTKQ